MAQQAQWTIGDYSGSQGTVERIDIRPEHIDLNLFHSPIKKGSLTLPSVEDLFAPYVEKNQNNNITTEFIDGCTVKCKINDINEEEYNSLI